MDNVGDWIYIVFLIIAAVSGLFGSKNKKKRPTQVLGQPGHDTYQEENTSSEKGFWEMREDVKNVAPKRTSPSKTTHKKIKKKKEGKSPNAFLSAEKEIYQPNAGVAHSTPNFPIEEEHSVLEDVEFNNAEELRKAVIYSEILNRKY